MIKRILVTAGLLTVSLISMASCSKNNTASETQSDSKVVSASETTFDRLIKDTEYKASVLTEKCSCSYYLEKVSKVEEGEEYIIFSVSEAEYKPEYKKDSNYSYTIVAAVDAFFDRERNLHLPKDQWCLEYEGKKEFVDAADIIDSALQKADHKPELYEAVLIDTACYP